MMPVASPGRKRLWASACDAVANVVPAMVSAMRPVAMAVFNENMVFVLIRG